MTLNKIKNNKVTIFVILAYIYTFISSKELGMASLENTLYYLKEMVFIMPIIFSVIVAIEVFISKEYIGKKLGANSGISGFLYSLLLGSLSAGPIYAAFPVCKLLLKKGATIANIVVILSAWAVVKIPMLANEVRFLGFEFMYTRWILTVISIFIFSKIVARFVTIKDIPMEDTFDFTRNENISVNENSCIGCSLCSRELPKYFGFENKLAFVKPEPLILEDFEKIKEIESKCSSKSIKIKNL